MSYRIECIPNVSTADPAILERIAAAIEATEGVTLHFVDAGKSANRTVFTYLGPASQVFKATEALFAIALSEDELLINLDAAIHKVVIYDLYGSKVLESRQKKIDVMGLSKGLYLVKISSTAGMVTKKMIKS